MTDLSLMVQYLLKDRTPYTLAEATSVSHLRLQDYLHYGNESILTDAAVRRIIHLFEREVINEKLTDLRKNHVGKTRN